MMNFPKIAIGCFLWSLIEQQQQQQQQLGNSLSYGSITSRRHIQRGYDLCRLQSQTRGIGWISQA